MALRQDEIVVSYRVEGSSSIDGARAAFDKLTQAEKDAIEQAKKLGKEVDNSTKGVKTNVDSTTGSVGKFGGALTRVVPIIAAAFSVKAVIDFGMKILDVTAKMEQYQKRINFAAGSAQEGAKVTQYLTGITRKFGLDLETVIQTYSSFAAASKASNLSQEDTIKIFEGVTKAVAAFGLSAEQSQGAFLAITQMISKGTVQAEELRGQLGERLPGSFAIAARSIGVTEQKLNKMLEQGEVISKDFLPKFAAELEKTFGAEAAANVDTLTGKQNLLATAYQEVVITLGEKLRPAFEGLIGQATQILNLINEANKSQDQKQQERIAKNIEVSAKNAETAVFNRVEMSRTENRVLTQAEAALGLYNLALVKREELTTKILDKEVEVNLAAGFDGRQQGLQKELDVLNEKLQYLDAQVAVYERLSSFEVEGAKKAELNQKELNKAYLEAIRLQQALEDLQIRRKKLELSIGANEAEQAINENEIIKIKKKSTEEKLKIDREYAALEVKIAQEALAGRLLSIEEFNKDALKLEYDRVVGIADLEKKANADMRQIMSDKKKNEKTDINNSLSLAKARQKIAEDEVDETTKARNKALQEQAETREQAINREIMNLGNVLADGVSNLVSNAIKKPIQEEYAATVALYEQQMQLFEGNLEMQAAARDRFEAKERELKKRAFIADKQAAIANAIFQASPNIIKLATNPITAPAAIIAGAALTAQIAFIAGQPMPEFARGTESVEGPGTGTSDSIVARLSKGERVMTARQNKPLLDLGIKNDDIPKIVLDYMSLTSGRTKGSNSRGIERKLDDLNRSIKSLPVAAISLDGKGFSKSIRQGNRTSVILNNQFVN